MVQRHAVSRGPALRRKGPSRATWLSHRGEKAVNEETEAISRQDNTKKVPGSKCSEKSADQSLIQKAKAEASART